MTITPVQQDSNLVTFPINPPKRRGRRRTTIPYPQPENVFLYQGKPPTPVSTIPDPIQPQAPVSTKYDMIMEEFRRGIRAEYYAFVTETSKLVSRYTEMMEKSSCCLKDV